MAITWKDGKEITDKPCPACGKDMGPYTDLCDPCYNLKNAISRKEAMEALKYFSEVYPEIKAFLKEIARKEKGR